MEAEHSLDQAWRKRSEIKDWKMRQEKPGEAAPAIYLLHHGLVAAEDPADADYALLPSVHLCPGRVRIVDHVHGQPAHINAPSGPPSVTVADYDCLHAGGRLWTD
jgi:hypothetical protein